MKSIGPNTEPCSTPQDKESWEEVELSRNPLRMARQVQFEPDKSSSTDTKALSILRQLQVEPDKSSSTDTKALSIGQTGTI